MKTGQASDDEHQEILQAVADTYDFVQALTADMDEPSAAQFFVLTVAAVSASIVHTNRENFLRLAGEVWDQIEQGSRELLN